MAGSDERPEPELPSPAGLLYAAFLWHVPDDEFGVDRAARAMEQVTQFLRRYREAAPEPFEEAYGEALAEFVAFEPHSGSLLLEELVEQATAPQCPYTLPSPTKRAVGALLEHADEEVRERALQLLGRLEEVEAVEADTPGEGGRAR